jgi:hypothetical protein
VASDFRVDPPEVVWVQSPQEDGVKYLEHRPEKVAKHWHAALSRDPKPLNGAWWSEKRRTQITNFVNEYDKKVGIHTKGKKLDNLLEKKEFEKQWINMNKVTPGPHQIGGATFKRAHPDIKEVI